MSEEGNVAQLCTHAHISTAEVPFAGDLMDAWEEPSSHFLMSGAQQPLGFSVPMTAAAWTKMPLEEALSLSCNAAAGLGSRA